MWFFFWCSLVALVFSVESEWRCNDYRYKLLQRGYSQLIITDELISFLSSLFVVQATKGEHGELEVRSFARARLRILVLFHVASHSILLAIFNNRWFFFLLLTIFPYVIYVSLYSDIANGQSCCCCCWTIDNRSECYLCMIIIVDKIRCMRLAQDVFSMQRERESESNVWRQCQRLHKKCVAWTI